MKACYKTSGVERKAQVAETKAMKRGIENLILSGMTGGTIDPYDVAVMLLPKATLRQLHCIVELKGELTKTGIEDGNLIADKVLQAERAIERHYESIEALKCAIIEHMEVV